MASFASNPNILGSFNPYIEQVPVDEYVKVGLMKQQQYDQGVQKVQSAVDSIAGLPVIKQEQKEYLQQRLGQLNNNISKIVGQDFSQSQLTNQVGALANQISADPIIQNAVQSTMRYQSEAQKMQTAQTAGKSDPANEYVFQKQASDWLNDKDVRSSFRGGYTPFVDANKALLEVMKQMHPDSNIQDIPFKIGADGKPMVNADGTPQIDVAMTQRQTKGITADMIQSAINILPESVQQQLRINGQYQYKDFDKVGMKKITDESYQNRLTQIDDIVKGLKVKKLSNIDDTVYQKSLDDQIKDMGTHRDTLFNQYTRDVNAIDNGNLDAYKGELYAEGWKQNTANAFSYADNSLTYHENSYFKAHMEEVRAEREARSLDIAERRLQLLEERNAMTEQALLDKEKKEGIGSLGGKQGLSGLVGTPVRENIDQSSLPKVNQTSFAGQEEDMRRTINGSKMNLLSSIPALADDFTIDTKDGDTSPTISYRDDKAKAEAEVTYKKLRDDWAAGRTVPPGWKEHFESSANMDQRIKNMDGIVSDIRKEANAKYIDTDKMLSNVKGINITTQSGQSMYISPDDITHFLKQIPQVLKTAPSLPGQRSSGQQYLDEAKAQQLFNNPKMQQLYLAFKSKMGNLPMNDAVKLINDRIGSVSKLVSDNYQQIAARDNYIDNRLNQVTTIKQPVAFSLNVAKKEAEIQVRGTVNNLLGNFEGQGAGKLPANSNVDTIRKMNSDPNTTYSLEDLGGGRVNIILANGDPKAGGPNQRIPLTQDQAADLFPDSNLNEFSAVKEALNGTKNMKVNTTDVTHQGVMSAFVLKNDNLNKYGVKYHIESPNHDGRYQVRAYIGSKNSPIGDWKEFIVDLPSLIDDNQLAIFLSRYGDADIDRMLSQGISSAILRQ